MRTLLILLWIIVVVLLLATMVRRLRPGRRRPAAMPDQLVKDPVCQTYVVRSRALSRSGPEGPLYFCSEECLRRYAAGVRG